MHDDAVIRNLPAGYANVLSTTEGEATKEPADFPGWEKAAAICLFLLTTLLDCIHLPGIANENTYYATAVKSMLLSWHNFFFVAFDSAGYLSIDKPPLGLWAEATSARLFGFSVFSLVLPEIVAGSASVLLLYYLVRRTFGAPAGILAGTLLALSPINVVTNRDNIMDSLLVVTSLAAAWAVLRAAETTSFKWLALCAIFIGIGFNIKMLEAFLIVPACLVTYLASTKDRSFRLRLAQVLLFGFILAGISFSWVAAVDLTPPSDRPYVDSTVNNSEVDLAFNYNGLQRLFGQPLYGKPSRPPSPVTGPSGPLRLLQPQLGGQVSWLLPLAIIGLLAASWITMRTDDFRRPRHQAPTTQKQAYLFWLTWLVTAGAFFSVAQFFNLYYLAILAPPLAALAGIGTIALIRSYLGNTLRWWLLPAAILATGVEQTIILSAHPAWLPWLLPLVGIATIVAAALLISLKIMRADEPHEAVGPGHRFQSLAADQSGSLPAIMAVVSLSVLLIAPLLWLAASYRPTNEGGFPLSGPIVISTTAVTDLRTDPRLMTYLETHRQNANFLVATVSVQDAIPIMWATGEPVMALGGYSGYDPILTPKELARAVRSDRVRFFLLPSSNLAQADVKQFYPQALTHGRSFTTRYTNQLTRWVSRTCTLVPPLEWQNSPGLAALQLFACSG
jgi:4-amino-4-deoxy-L-arabinose transferase-like glycosyltransferase